MRGKRIRLTKKEIARASTDGFVIVARPSSDGGYNVFAVRVADTTVVGWPRHVLTKADISAACTSINRDMDKFLGIGAEMSDAGRMRPGRKQYLKR